MQRLPSQFRSRMFIFQHVTHADLPNIVTVSRTENSEQARSTNVNELEGRQRLGFPSHRGRPSFGPGPAVLPSSESLPASPAPAARSVEEASDISIQELEQLFGRDLDAQFKDIKNILRKVVLTVKKVAPYVLLFAVAPAFIPSFDSFPDPASQSVEDISSQELKELFGRDQGEIDARGLKDILQKMVPTLKKVAPYVLLLTAAPALIPSSESDPAALPPAPVARSVEEISGMGSPYKDLFPITHREGPYFGPGFGIHPAVLPSPSVAPAFQPSASPMSGSGPVGPAVQPSSELPDPSPDPVARSVAEASDISHKGLEQLSEFLRKYKAAARSIDSMIAT